MKRIYRRTVFLIALAAFLVLGPLLALYAIGYRWGRQAGEPQSVGVLLVESTPRRADLSINGQPRGTTPRAISNLPPGPVEVVVSAAGYRSYQKQLTIEPGQITEARAIRLIPETLEPSPLRSGVQRFSVAPNRRAIAIMQENQLSVIDTDGTTIMPPRLLPAPESLLWSPDSTQLLVQHVSGEVRAVNLSNGAIQTLLPLARATDIAWDPRVPSRLLGLLPDGSLIAYHVALAQDETIATDITVFNVSSRSIFAVDSRAQLRHLTLQGEEVARHALAAEPKVSRLLITPAGSIALLFADGALSLFTEQRELLPVAHQVRRAGWSPDGQLLYLQTDPASVHVYNAADERHASIALGQQQLIVRLSRPLRDLQWFAGGSHLVFQVDDEIIMAEIDTRDHSQTVTIDSTNLGQSQTEVGEDGQELFYLKEQDGVTTLVSTPLLTGSTRRVLGIKNLL